VWLILFLLGCNGASESGEKPGQLDVELVSAVSWQQRAKGLEADLREVLVLAESGQRKEAQNRLSDVYETSYEKELEVVIREYLSPKKALEIEFLFGGLMEGLSRSRERKVRLKALLAEISSAAKSLDVKVAERSETPEE